MRKYFILFLFITFITLHGISSTHAAGTKYVSIGENPTINWLVSTGGCTASVSPNTTFSFSGSKSSTGSGSVGIATSGGTWTFSCNAPGYGCSPSSTCDSSTLIVCPSGQLANGARTACVAAAAPNCSSQVKTWTEGGYSCTGDVGTGSTGDGFSTGQTDTTPTNTGSAVYTCNGTTNSYTYNGGTCAPASVFTCPSGQYWTSGNVCRQCTFYGPSLCSGPGGTQADPDGGLTCDNGGSNPPTCTPPVGSAPCSTEVKSWGVGCMAAPAAGPHGTVRPGLMNVSGGYSGSSDFTCNNGTWTPSNSSCSVAGAPCPQGVLKTWGGACSANLDVFGIGDVPTGGSRNATDSTGPDTGWATFQCNSGNWDNIGGTCNASCVNGANNPPMCDNCPNGYDLIGGVCVLSTAIVCVNGANNPPLCTTCNVGYGPTVNAYGRVISCDPPPSEGPGVCGSGNGGRGLASQPSGSAACSDGTFGEIDDTATTWNWECQGPSIFGNTPCSAGKAAGIPFGVFTSTPSCNIASGASTCSVPISWTSANLSSVYLTDCAGGLYDSRGVGNQTYSSVTVPYSAGEPSTPGCYQIHNGSALGPVLDTILGSANCVRGTSWDGLKCTDLPTGTLTITPPSCVIPRDGHQCNVLLTSDAVNVDRIEVWRDSPDPRLLFADRNRSSVVRGLSTTFTLKGYRAESWVPSYHPEFYSALDSKVATASCNTAAGDWWDASERFWDASIADFAFGKCKAPVSMTLTVPNCVISADQSTCVAKPSSMSGGTAGWSYGLENITAVRSTVNLFSSPSWTYNPGSGIGTAVELAYGANTINLYATNKGAGTAWFVPILRTVTATASCTAGTSWDSTKCVLPSPTASLVVGATNLSYNGQTSLTWSSTGASGSGCVAGGPWLNSPNNAGSGLTDPLTTTSTFTFQCSGVTGTSTLISRTVTVCSAATPIWTGAVCRPAPSVGPVGLTGQYTPTGTLTFTCNDADRYEVWRGLRNVGTLVQPSTPYPGIGVSVPITIAGNYNVHCSALDWTGTRIYSSPSVKWYSPVYPTPPVMFITASPKTIQKGTESVINWNIKYPNPLCKVTATPVCSGTCLGERDSLRIANTALISAKLVSSLEKTDTNDRYGSRKLSESFWKPINPLEDDKVAAGKKTLLFNSTTDFTLDCNTATTTNPVKKIRVNVTSSNEG